MNNSFEISVVYNAKEIDFPAELIPYGYSHKIEVDVFGKIISFERDEEQNFRAVINYDDLSNADSVNKALLGAITEQLVALFKD